MKRTRFKINKLILLFILITAISALNIIYAAAKPDGISEEHRNKINIIYERGIEK